jgi:hypothetical protein
MKLHNILIFLVVSCNFVYAQEIPLKNRLFTEFTFKYGYAMPHHDYMSYFVEKHIQGIQLNIGVSSLGDKKWHHYYNFPRYGIGFYHSGLGNDAIFGKMHAMYFFFDRLYLKNQQRFNFGNQIAFGLSYITKRYDLNNNPFDMVIGSRLNVYINFNVDATMKIVPQLYCKAGVGLTHASNGNFKEPNKGINLITSFVSLQYSFKHSGLTSSEKELENADTDKNQFLVSGAFGWKSISRFHSYYYPVYAISAEYARHITYTNSIGLALTGYVDKSLHKELSGEEAYNGTTQPDLRASDYVRLALNLSYELRTGKVSYLIQPGFYLKNAYKNPGIITNRIGLRYYFNTKWAASVMVKAHWMAIADVVEWGVGYRLFNPKPLKKGL